MNNGITSLQVKEKDMNKMLDNILKNVNQFVAKSGSNISNKTENNNHVVQSNTKSEEQPKQNVTKTETPKVEQPKVENEKAKEVTKVVKPESLADFLF